MEGWVWVWCAAEDAAASAETFDLSRQIPVNLLKEGPEPEYKPDADYPPWLFQLLEPKVPRSELLQRDARELSNPERKSIFRQSRRAAIRQRNREEKKT
jgi:Mitochondrial ribosomal protein L37